MNYAFSILFESFWSNSLVPFGHEPTAFAMRAFGNFDMMLPFILSLLGATLGQLFNWALGAALSRFLPRRAAPSPRMEKCIAFFNRYGIYLLLFSWAPLCKLLPLIAGVTGVRLRTALPLIMAGVAGYYRFYLL